jgi:transcriptional antiterminator RfaH
VSSLVRFGKDPATVPDVLIELLLARESTSGLHDWAEARLSAGQAVRVVDGVMQGYEGIFVASSGRERVVVLLDILGRQVRARVEASQLISVE